MSFDYFSKRRMQYILEKLKTIFDTKADISDVPDTFADLTDTAFANLQNGQVAIYNSTAGKWENQTPNYGEIFTIVVTSTGTDPETHLPILEADKTPSEVVAALNDGKVLETILDTGDGVLHLSLMQSFISSESTIFIFETSVYLGDLESGELRMYTLEFSKDNDSQEDVWGLIEISGGDLETQAPIIKFYVDEDEGVYSMDQNFQELLDAYYSYQSIFLTCNGQEYAYEKYDSSTHTFYFTSTLADSIKTLVLVGNYSTGEWTSITLTESSGGDPNAIKWSEAKTSVKKNWLPVALNTKTANGVTYTVNSDKTITVNGTCTANINTYINEFIKLPEGDYIISGVPDGTNANANLWIGLYDGSSYSSAQRLRADTGKYTWAFTVTSSIKYVSVRIDIDKDFVANNLVFRPMIRLASIENDTYVPYIPDNVDLETKKISWEDVGTSVKKNYMQLNKSGVSQTINGITFTVNSDMSVTINGTATDTTTFYLTNAFDISKFNGMYLSGNPIADASVAILRVEMISSPWTGYSQYGDIDTLIGNYSSGTNGTAFIRVFNGKTVNNVTIKPMIRLATIEDSTYAPYIPDNTELMRYTDNNILGAKNLLPTPYADSSKVQNGITWTYNSDGTVVANGTATGNTDFYLIKNTAGSSLQWLNGKILSGVSNGSSSTYYLYLLQSNSPWTAYLTVYNGESVIYGIPNDSTLVTLMIRVTSGTTVSNLVFKPMIRLATDTDSTYVPYAKTNLQLTKDLGETSKNTIKWNDAKTSVKKNHINSTKPIGDTTTINGLTFTVNSDKSVTINGTATAVTDYVIAGFWNNTNILVPSNSYTLSLGASTVNAHITIKAIYVTTVLSSTYTSGTFNAPNGITEFFIRVDNGAVISNITVHPMLRLASIEDDTYVPYIPDNTELVDWKSNGVLGAKNLLDCSYTKVKPINTSGTWSNASTYSYNGHTFTLNSNGSITVSVVNAESNTDFYLVKGNGSELQWLNGLRISGVTGGSSSTYSIIVYGLLSPYPIYCRIYSDSGVISGIPNDSTLIGVCIRINRDISATSITFKPMLRLVNDSDDTFQPYAMTNRQLTELIPVWSSSVSALTGATSVTITDANIHTTSVIEPFADNGTNTAMSMPTMTVTEGQCVLGFDALTADTTFKLRITN